MSTTVNGSRLGAASGAPPSSGPPRPSAIPTPGRPRSSSTAVLHPPTLDDHDFAARAFADAIRANDPAHHRPLLSNSQSTSVSGRNSVAGRSSTSSSSVPPPRPKTPASARPPSRPASRQSDVFTKSTARSFEVGDNVRIESLGYEGVLKYVGEIDGKLGLWAGVELSGGFAGKGKNNGSVNGKEYFSCPVNCGVFVAISKLSPPTVGVGAVSRPPSVVSSRGGRVTPALSGRITPSGSSLFGSRLVPSASVSNGRITPSSSGRITPSLSSGRRTPAVTPGPRAPRPLAQSTRSNPDPNALANKFTAGSRASKYVTMTAKQLTSRAPQPASPTPRVQNSESPGRPQALYQLNPKHTSSPTRHQSPFGTPKPGSSRTSIGLPTPTKAGPSLSTPRPRIPSAVAMPPPASPMSARSISLNDLRVGDVDQVSPSESYQGNNSFSSAATSSLGRPDSAMSMRSLSGDDGPALERLQSRIEALEYDNERLRNSGRLASPHPGDALHLENLSKERDDALDRIAQLEASLLASSTAIDVQVASLEQQNQEARLNLETQKHDMQRTIDAIQQKLECETDVVRNLQATISEKETIIGENSASVSDLMADIRSLQLKLESLSTELQREKQDMGAQIDELRMAGQETIALYEERLNTADSEKYELRNRISSLESGIQNVQRLSHPSSSQQGLSTAIEIDNETLREQVLHLQQKISSMEDMLEDAHVSSQREEAALREKIQRLKEKDEGMRKELGEGHREVERMVKAEVNARNRVEEIEEALRESTVALENARAEVESLRAELANLDGLVANSSGGDLYSRVAEVARRASSDRVRYKDEVAELRKVIEEYQSRGTPASNSPSKVEIAMLREENAILQQAIARHEEKAVTQLQALDGYSGEVESPKKKNNREVTINTDMQEILKTPSKHDGFGAREQITGLKHIVQELQKENSTTTQRIKFLESENQLLQSEAQQLRQEVHILEENLDQGLVPEKSGTIDSVAADTPEKLNEQKIRLELERDQLEKQLAEAERKSARTIHDLNKEISELEALVESKIYREDELEQELERMKEKLARQGKTLRSSSESVDVQRRSAGGIVAVCEICERPGHDIFNCDVLNKETPASLLHGKSKPSPDLFCEDCESHGHVAADCPHSLDVF